MRRAMLLVAVLSVACEVKRERPQQTRAAGSAPASDAPVVVELPSGFRNVGRPARADEVRAWNIDANPSGAGLPAGRGTYARGAQVYAAQCASCHGPKGEGIPPNPKLIGPEPRDFSFATDFKIAKTVGNYWPYATTLYDYINRAMPFSTPGSLRPDDLYSVIAFLLAENQIIDRNAVIDARSLPKIKMPGHDHFVRDDRMGARAFR